MSVVLNPILTQGGQEAAINAGNTGIELGLTHIAYGTAAYSPTGFETSLQDEVARIPIAYGSRVQPKQFRVASVWRSDVGNYPINEIGVYAGEILVAILSRTGSTPYAYKTAGVDFVFYYDIAIQNIPANSITVVADEGQAAVIAELGNHLNHADPHPQYLLKADYLKRDGKNSVRYTTTGALTLSGLAVQAGGEWAVSLTQDDRILVRNQTDPAFNGIYTANTGAWSRAEDADSSLNLTPGLLITVEEGTTYAESVWTLSTDGPITIDTTPLTYQMVYGKTGVAAGDYNKVTVNAYGQVMAGSNPTTLAGHGIDDAFTKTEIAQKIGDYGAVAYRNSIINGGFDHWQRATSQTASGYSSDDRWLNAHSGSTKTHSRQAFTVGQTAVLGDPIYYSRTVVTSVAGSGNYASKEQRIEGVRRFSGRNIRISFDAKADASKNIALELSQSFGTGGSPSSDIDAIGAQLVALTTSWQRKAVTVAIPSISGKTLGSNGNDYLALRFWFDAGSSFDARTGSLGQQDGTFDIANVQVEEGTTETPVIRRPTTLELALCQRFYMKQTFSLQGYGAASQTVGVTQSHKVTMRAAPTPTLSGTALTNASALTATTTEEVVDLTATVTALGAFSFSGTYAADAEL